MTEVILKNQYQRAIHIMNSIAKNKSSQEKRKAWGWITADLLMWMTTNIQEVVNHADKFKNSVQKDAENEQFPLKISRETSV